MRSHVYAIMRRNVHAIMPTCLRAELTAPRRAAPRRRVAECPCPYAKGCPDCIHHLDCRNYNAVLSKAAAEVVLRHALEQVGPM